MKKLTLSIIITSMVMTSISSAQLLFGVKPGLFGSSGQFGLNVGGVMVFGGLEYIRTATTTEESGTRIVYSYMNTFPFTTSYQLEPYDNKNEASVNIYAPFVGAKILLGGGESGKTGAYITGAIGKPFISGKSVSNGKESESTNKLFDGLSTWMFTAGFGGEYFMSEDFSIGGEFGLRVFLVSYKEEDTEQIPAYDFQTGTTKYYNTTRKYDFDLGLGITYSTLVLNYYL